MTGLILFGSFIIMLIISVPIALALGVATAITLFYIDMPVVVVAQRIFTALDSSSIMAIPFFVLAGNLMTEGGISRRIVELANSIVGGVRGGLFYVMVISCAFFAALSGSAPATVIAIGAMLYPEMVKRGYPEKRSAGLLAVAGGLGPIIPPSIIMVVYGTITSSSIGDLFKGGIVAGIMIMIVLFVICAFLSKKENWPKSDKRLSIAEFTKALWSAGLAVMLPVIVLGGIYSGILTPTESAAVAVIYSYLVGTFVYKELNFKAFAQALFITGKTTGIILLIIMNAGIFSWVLTEQGIAARLTEFAISLTSDKIVMLLIINIVFLCAGCVMDNTSALFILVPIVMPIAKALGIDMIHLGVVLVLNLSIGQVTPPVGPNLYVAADIAKVKFEKIMRGVTPLLLVSIVALLIVTFVPWLSLCLL